MPTALVAQNCRNFVLCKWTQYDLSTAGSWCRELLEKSRALRLMLLKKKQLNNALGFLTGRDLTLKLLAGQLTNALIWLKYRIWEFCHRYCTFSYRGMNTYEWINELIVFNKPANPNWFMEGHLLGDNHLILARCMKSIPKQLSSYNYPCLGKAKMKGTQQFHRSIWACFWFTKSQVMPPFHDLGK